MGGICVGTRCWAIFFLTKCDWVICVRTAASVDKPIRAAMPMREPGQPGALILLLAAGGGRS